MNDMNKKTILSVISFFVVLSANAQLLFRISGNGLKEPSYILGTIHYLPGSLLDSIPEFRRTRWKTSTTEGGLP